MSKTLFIEDSPFLTRLVVSDELKESIQIKQGKNNTLIVKNIPGTILNRTNQNGRIYSTAEIQKALDAAKQQIATKQLLCSCDEHPEGSFVSPSHAAFVIIGAYIKKNVKLEVEGEKGTYDVLFCDIEVLNTSEGKNLQALLLSGCSLGTSIRGLGDMDGDQVVNYEFLGFDIVSNPSSGTFTNMPIYEAKIESIEENALNEASKFTVTTYASNTTHDLNQAMDFQDKATELEYGTITNMNTKMDQEVDPKTGVTKTVGEVEVETSDDVSDLQTAMQIAGRAFTNPDNINVTSITIEKVDEDDMKDSVMQGGTSDTLKEEDGEWVVRLVDADNNECFAGENESELVNDIAAAKKFSTQEEAEMFKAKYPADVESVDPDTGIVTHYVSVEAKNIKENEELPQEAPVEEQVLKEVEISQGMWIKTELLDPTAVYYVDEVTDDGVYLCKNSTNRRARFFIKTDGSYVFPWEEVKDEEPVEEAATDGTIAQDDTTLTIDVDGNEVEKDFRTPEEARVAKAGLENGELTADVMYDESSSWWGLKVKAGEFADWVIKQDGDIVDITADETEAVLFPTEEEARKFQQENNCEEYEYENGLRTDVEPYQVGITDEEIFGKKEESDIAADDLNDVLSKVRDNAFEHKEADVVEALEKYPTISVLMPFIKQKAEACQKHEITTLQFFKEISNMVEDFRKPFAFDIPEDQWQALRQSDSFFGSNVLEKDIDNNIEFTEDFRNAFELVKNLPEMKETVDLYEKGLIGSVELAERMIKVLEDKTSNSDESNAKEEANIDEKLYASEDPASDSFEQEPVIEDKDDLKVVLGEISYDIDDEPDFEGDPEEIEELLENHLPETVEIQLNGGKVPEENVEQYIYEKAREQTGLPIKNATIISIEEIGDEVKEDIDMDSSIDMFSDEDSGLDSDSIMADAADGDADVDTIEEALHFAGKKKVNKPVNRAEDLVDILNKNGVDPTFATRRPLYGDGYDPEHPSKNVWRIQSFIPGNESSIIPEEREIRFRLKPFYIAGEEKVMDRIDLPLSVLKVWAARSENVNSKPIDQATAAKSNKLSALVNRFDPFSPEHKVVIPGDKFGGVAVHGLRKRNGSPGTH